MNIGMTFELSMKYPKMAKPTVRWGRKASGPFEGKDYRLK
jgi:hypothetical protein